MTKAAFKREASHFLASVGYSPRDLAKDFRYTICTESGSLESRSVPLVAFSGAQRNMRTACVTAFEARSTEHALSELRDLRFLAAPASIVAMNGTVSLYAVHSRQDPVVVDSLDRATWQARLLNRTEYLSAQALMSAKRGERIGTSLDPKLFSWAEDFTEKTLSGLLEDVYAVLAESLPKRRRESRAGQESVLKLLFRLLAVRVLEDRKRVSPTDEPWQAIEQANSVLTLDSTEELSRTYSEDVVGGALNSMREQFSFDSLTPETLAYSYENALVSKQAKAELGIYYTPRAITRYVLDHLPLESLPQSKRAVLDPCCGSGSFLLAAHERLNSLLPAEWGTARRHRYLTDRIAGMDVDPFARETARLALILAGIETGNGWQIREGNALEPIPDDLPREPTVIVTNPPFREMKVAGTRREMSAEILSNLLNSLPVGGFVGVVVPQSVLESDAAVDVRREILQTCSLMEIATFPGPLFESNAETAVLLARKEGASSRRGRVVTVRECSGRDVAEFKRSRKFSTTYSVVVDEWLADEKARFVASPFFEFWARLSDTCDSLGEVAHVENGLQVKPNDDTSVTAEPQPGAVKFVERVGPAIAPYLFLADGDISQPMYLDYGDHLHRARQRENFEPPKVLISSNRNPAYTWRLVAAPVPKAIYYSENFQGLRPRDNRVNVPVLAAILNSHVANAWFHAHCRKRKIVLRILKELPVPRLDALQLEILTERVSSLAVLLKAIYRRRMDAPLFWHNDEGDGEPLEDMQEKATLLLGEIDSLVFDAYGATERERRAFLKYMAVDKRPGPL